MAVIGVFARTRLLGVGLLALTFVAGALSGAAIDRALGVDVVQASPDPARADRDRGRDRERSYVIDRVEMGEDQRARIDSILDRRTDRMRVVWREVEPRMEAITDSARAEIMGVLTPDQRDRYQALLDERRKRRRSGDGGS